MRKGRMWLLIALMLLSFGVALAPTNAAEAATNRVAAVSTVDSAKVLKQVCTTVVNDDLTVASKTCKVADQSLNQWGYCTVYPASNKITFYDNQGYCGDSVQFNSTAFGSCRYMGQWQNWAGSMVNWTVDELIASDQINCAGSPSIGVPITYNIPDLYNYNGVNVGNKLSSFTSFP